MDRTNTITTAAALVAMLGGCSTNKSSDDGHASKPGNPDKNPPIQFSMAFENTLSADEAREAFTDLFARIDHFHMSELPGLPCPAATDGNTEQGQQWTETMVRASGLAASAIASAPLRDGGNLVIPEDNAISTTTLHDEPERFAISYTVHSKADTGSQGGISLEGDIRYQYGGNDESLFAKSSTDDSSVAIKTTDTEVKGTKQIRILEYDRLQEAVTVKLWSVQKINGNQVGIEESSNFSLADLNLDYERRISSNSPKSEAGYSSNYSREGDILKMAWRTNYKGVYAAVNKKGMIPDGAAEHAIVADSNLSSCIDPGF